MFLLSDDYWEINDTKEKGRGVFTKKEIQPGTIIGDYIGKVIKISEYNPDRDKNGLFLMYLTDNAAIYPDRHKPGIHLINHSCNPNCWMYIYKGHTLFFALRKIVPGEELTISYLLSPKDATCNPCPHVCTCQSISCIGTMHLPKDKYKIWQRFQTMQKKKTKISKFTYGKNLPRLTYYPKMNPYNPIYQKMIYG